MTCRIEVPPRVMVRPSQVSAWLYVDPLPAPVRQPEFLIGHTSDATVGS